MGVVIRRWVWSECIDVVSWWCCKDVYTYMYIDFLILLTTTPFVLALFWQQHPYFFVHFKNVFSVLFLLFLLQYIANVVQRTFKSFKNRDHTDMAL